MSLQASCLVAVASAVVIELALRSERFCIVRKPVHQYRSPNQKQVMSNVRAKPSLNLGTSLNNFLLFLSRGPESIYILLPTHPTHAPQTILACPATSFC